MEKGLRTMKHLSVAWKLREIADLLELLGENSYKVRAYEKASESLERFTGDLEEIWRAGQLTGIDGVGATIAQRIEEILLHGDSLYLRELKKSVPEGMGELLNIPGLGPKMARRLRNALSITSITELEAALEARKIRELPGMNGKTEMTLLRGIKQMRMNAGRVLLGGALPLAREVMARLRRVPGLQRLEITGSARRYKETVGDVDLLAEIADSEQLLEIFTSMPECREVVRRDTFSAEIVNRYGVHMELFTAKPEDFALKLLLATGSKSHVESLLTLAQEKGVETRDGVWRDDRGAKLVFQSEEEIYQKLGLQYIIPELREDPASLIAAREGWLPQSMSLAAIKGDLHMHTRWSDGVAGLLEMVETCRQKGYEYMAICDHSRSLKIARGMSLEMLREQMKAIDELNAVQNGFRIFKGIEGDILKDGQLDYPDEILRELDIVVASIHTGFAGSEEELTMRIIKAMENPYVDIIGHPTGRLIQRRDPYAVNIERILRAAKDTGTAVEINSTPDRLDLCEQHLKMCKALGVKVAINTDAHSTDQLDYMEYGVGMARRGWLEDNDVINTYPLAKFLEFIG